MTVILKSLAIVCVSLAISFIFARSVIGGIRSKKIYLKSVGYDQYNQPKMFAFAMGFNTLVSAVWLLNAIYFVLGGDF